MAIDRSGRQSMVVAHNAASNQRAVYETTHENHRASFIEEGFGMVR